MEKPQELKKKILKILLPKAVITGVVLTFHNPVFSPRSRRNHQVVHSYHKHHHQHGPMMIPDEARIRRRRSKKGGSSSSNPSIKSLEPTSPTVSCMGQIKNKKKHQHQQRIKRSKSKRITVLPNNVNHSRPLLRSVSEVKKNKKQTTSTFQRMFRRRGRKSSRASSEVDGGSAAVVAAPALSQMKRFESRRGALANFDWKAHVVVAPEEEDDVDEDDDETIISFSEPIVTLHPKTEINLWKRRNMAPPPSLRSNPPPAPI